MPAPRQASQPDAQEDLLPRLQAALQALPDALSPLDPMAIDGYLCGVLLQPLAVPLRRWLPWVVDEQGREQPPARLGEGLVDTLLARHAQLKRAIEGRRWFDPWILEPDEDDGEDPSETVAPWVTGFALAMETFPALEDRFADALTEPLALLYRHLDPDDLEDDPALAEAIETLEPPDALDEAVEDLVQAVMLMADLRDGRDEAAR